jgi:hypothetical protein
LTAWSLPPDNFLRGWLVTDEIGLANDGVPAAGRFSTPDALVLVEGRRGHYFSNAEPETADERREEDSEGGRSEWMMGGERLRGEEQGTKKPRNMSRDGMYPLHFYVRQGPRCIHIGARIHSAVFLISSLFYWAMNLHENSRLDLVRGSELLTVDRRGLA